MASSLQALPPWCLGSALGSGCDATWDDYPGTTYAPLNVSTDNDFLGDFPLFSPDFALSDNDLLWGTMQPDPLLDSGSVDNDRMEQTGPVSSKSGRLLSTDWPDKEWNPTFETNMTPEQYSPTPDLEDCDDSGDYFSVKSESSSPLSTFSHRNLAERQTNDSSESSTRKDVKSTFSIRKRELPHLKDRDRDRTKKLHNAIERKYRGSLNSKFSEIDNWLSRHQSDPDDFCEDAPKKRTKGAILTRALGHLQNLESSKSKLEAQNCQYRDQAAQLKQLLLAQQKQLRAVKGC